MRAPICDIARACQLGELRRPRTIHELTQLVSSQQKKSTAVEQAQTSWRCSQYMLYEMVSNRYYGMNSKPESRTLSGFSENAHNKEERIEQAAT